MNNVEFEGAACPCCTKGNLQKKEGERRNTYTCDNRRCEWEIKGELRLTPEERIAKALDDRFTEIENRLERLELER